MVPKLAIILGIVSCLDDEVYILADKSCMIAEELKFLR